MCQILKKSWVQGGTIGILRVLILFYEPPYLFCAETLSTPLLAFRTVFHSHAKLSYDIQIIICPIKIVVIDSFSYILLHKTPYINFTISVLASF